MAEGSWVRVYHEDLIANYAVVWDDDRALAAWLRLLVLADKLWPSPAELPRGISRPVLDKLVKAKLVQLVVPHRFRLRGLDAQRQRQRDAAKVAADARWNADGNAERNAERIPDPNAEAMPHADGGARPQSGLVPPSGDSSAENEEQGSLRARGPISVPVKGMNGEVTQVDVTAQSLSDAGRLQRLAEELTGQSHVMANVHSGLGAKAVTEQLARHGFARVERAWRQLANRAKAEGSSAPTLRQIVLGADDILNPVPRADTKEQRADEEAAAFDRRVAKTHAELAKMRGENWRETT
jgi:hypothetical protein